MDVQNTVACCFPQDYAPHQQRRTLFPLPKSDVPARRPDPRPQDARPEVNFVWWEQFRHFPTPSGAAPPVATPPPSRQASQRYEPLPSFDDTPWRYVRRWPLPVSHFGNVRRGAYNVLGSFGAAGVSRRGVYRIADDSLAGYTVRVGVGAPPDLTMPPDGFAAALPVTVTHAPPGVGRVTLYVVTRMRDVYGLESVNQQPQLLVLDASGVGYPPPLLAPVSVEASQFGTGLHVTARYPYLLIDDPPATHWYVYVNTVPPVVGVDAPTRTVPVLGSSTLSINQSVAGPGAYYVTVALFRALPDGSLSPGVRVTTSVSPSPSSPASVPGAGNQFS